MRLDIMRQEIDQIDRELVRLLNRRASMALRIGKEKKKKNLPIRDPRREKAVLARVRRSSKGPLDGVQMEKIYKQIISACVKAEKGLR